MSTHTLLCFAHGKNGAWEAICVDFDIAVKGRSLEEVKDLLSHAVETYIEDAFKEAPVVRDALLSRRAPMAVKLSIVWEILFSVVLQLFPKKRRQNEFDARFTIQCPA
jgi:hypothetical protein